MREQCWPVQVTLGCYTPRHLSTVDPEWLGGTFGRVLFSFLECVREDCYLAAAQGGCRNPETGQFHVEEWCSEYIQGLPRPGNVQPRVSGCRKQPHPSAGDRGRGGCQNPAAGCPGGAGRALWSWNQTSEDGQWASSDQKVEGGERTFTGGGKPSSPAGKRRVWRESPVQPASPTRQSLPWTPVVT